MSQTPPPAAVPGQTPSPPPPSAQPHTPATLRQTIVLAGLLVVTTAGLIAVWSWLVSEAETRLYVVTKVPLAGVSARLEPGPPSFWFDREGKQLHHRGRIDRDLKKELMALLPDGADPAEANAYEAAISKLAFDSNEALEDWLFWLVVLGGVSGVLGVQLRSLTNFVGVTCFKNILDVQRWWPWYVIRPFVGFVLGMIAIIMVESQLLPAEGSTEARNTWWIGIAFLAGFGASDFTERLRLLTQTLFGRSDGS